MGAIPRHATSLSHDGRNLLVVSEYRHYEAAVYRDGQPNLLRPMIAPAEHLWGADMSSDGSVVVGNLGDKPFRWDQGKGLRPISGLPDNEPFSATAVSGNGAHVFLNAQAGVTHGIFWLHATSEPNNARQWSEAGGPAVLSPLSGNDYSRAAASSFSGETVVGGSVQVTPENAHVTRAVRWESGIISQLGSVAGHDSSMAHDVSGDGETVVGNVYQHAARPYWYVNPKLDAADLRSRAVLWNAAGNVFDLRSLLITKYQLGAQLEGWELIDANLISENGNVIVGYGVGPDGKGAAWVAILGVPEPSTLVLAASLLIFVASGRSIARPPAVRVRRYRPVERSMMPTVRSNPFSALRSQYDARRLGFSFASALHRRYWPSRGHVPPQVCARRLCPSCSLIWP